MTQPISSSIELGALGGTSSRHAIETLINESRSRPIVPFLGSGFSFSSGVPTISGVIDYLAKVAFAIQFDVYEHRYPRFLEGRNYKQHPSFFIEDYGWPSISALNADLWNWLARADGHHARTSIEANFSTDEQLVKDLFGVQYYPKYQNSEDARVAQRDYLTAIVQWSKRSILRDNDSGTTEPLLKEWKLWKKWYFGEAPKEPALLGGDWDELLDRTCEGNLDLIDSLFSSFEKGRSPTLAHRYISFLIDKLCVPAVLTTNFDSFLETALRDDGVEFRVFDVHRDASMPHASLVKRQLSLIKLHGSAYGLRVGERLNYPVETQARESVLGYLPEDSLLLVAGFSGSERRMTQLLKSLAVESGNQEGLRMLWLQGPGSPRPMLQQFSLEVGNRVSFASISDITTFLQEAYLTYGGGYQACRVPYAAIPGRPAVSAPVHVLDKDPVRLNTWLNKRRRPIQIFSTTNDTISSWAGLAIAQFAADCAKNGYNVLWIDMEKHHTVPGTVAEILQKARTLDPESPNIALFTDDASEVDLDSIQKAVKRIHEILKHGRYVLVLDSLESYARPQFQHHGIPSFSLLKWKAPTHVRESWGTLQLSYEAAEKHFNQRLDSLETFLELLLRWNEGESQTHAYYDSFICVSIAAPIGRHGGKSNALTKMTAIVDAFRDAGKRDHVTVHISSSNNYSDLSIQSRDASHSLTLATSNRTLWDECTSASTRLHAFLKLKLELQAIQQADSDSERDHYVAALQRNRDCRDGLIGVLSVFRRPRSIAAIRSMTERWLVGTDSTASASQLNSIRAAVDGIRDRQIVFGPGCSDAPYGMLHEGASLWLFREVQISYYRSMTNSLSTSRWVESVFSKISKSGVLNSKESAQLAKDAIVDGLICVALHIEASRVYYADTFMPTQDVESFYEYMYHRCWSVRTLSLMLAILRTRCPKHLNPFHHSVTLCAKTLIDVKDEMERENRRVVPDTCSPALYLGTFSSLPKTGIPMSLSQRRLETLLAELQRHCVVTLIQALHRQEEHLLHHATPETLDGWLSQIEQVVIPEVNGTVFSPFFLQRRNFAAIKRSTLNQFSGFVKGLRQRLKRPRQRVAVNSVFESYLQSLETVRQCERDAKDAQEEACFLWAVLEDEDDCRPWTFERNTNKKGRGEILDRCYGARSKALRYELELRRVMRDRELDARHRSCALAMRARAEYLLGHFRQAHHRLDVASGGLTDSPTHRASRSLIHAYRSELLIYSAEFHYSMVVRDAGRQRLTVSQVLKELRKIQRADREIRLAFGLVRDAEHLSRWRSLWSLGTAQIKLERIIYEAEALFIQRTSIGSRQYAERFGVFEQILLDGLRALRSALDEMPYLEEKWDAAKKMAKPRDASVERTRYFEFKVESKVWSLWRQFYVASAYFESLLGLYSRSPVLTGTDQLYQGDALSILNLVVEGAEGFNYERWRYWNQAVRFDDFARIEPFDGKTKLTLPMISAVPETVREDSRQSLCKLMTSVMRIDICNSDVIKQMWNHRRPDVPVKRRCASPKVRPFAG